MENAAVAKKPQETLESLHARFAAETKRRQTTVDPDEAIAMVICAREAKRLTAIATDPNESPETRLEAAMRGLDLAGMTARSARFREHEPSELTLPELHAALARIDFELEDRLDRLAEVNAELGRRALPSEPYVHSALDPAPTPSLPRKKLPGTSYKPATSMLRTDIAG